VQNNVCNCQAIYRDGRLDSFITAQITVSIKDVADDAEPQNAPEVLKKLAKIEPCPDNTHLRFFFDHVTFLAIPFTSKTTCSEEEFHAFDAEENLHYYIRKGRIV
jgi:hypothetical protein